MKHKLSLLMLFTVLMYGLGNPSSTNALGLLEEYNGLNSTNYYADSVLSFNSGYVKEETTAAKDSSTQFKMNRGENGYLYLGFEESFDGFALDVDTNASGGSYSVEYYADSGEWKTLVSETNAGIRNGANGVFEINWSKAPSDWAKKSIQMVNEDGEDDVSTLLYFVRLNVEDEYLTAPVFERAGILKYNLMLETEDELDDEITTLTESNFSLSTTSGDEEIYAYKKAGNLHSFALYAQDTLYNVEITKDGYVTEELSTGSIDTDATTKTATLQYSHKIVGKNPSNSNSVELDTAIAGKNDLNCKMDKGDAYCAVKIADDNTEATLYADGYAPTTLNMGDRDSNTDLQKSTSVTMEYAYIATVKNSSGSKISNATVTMGNNYAYTCTALSDGEYGCIVPVNQDAKIRIVKSGYTTYSGSFSTERNSHDDDQETQSFTLTTGTNTDDDDEDQDLTVNDIYLDGEDLVIEAENEGELDVSSSDDVYVYVYVDGDRELSERIDESYFEAGEKVTITAMEGYFDVADEEWKVKVCIDGTDDVSESDEDNNCREETLGESYTANDEADLEVADLYLDSTDDLRVTFENTGDDDVDASRVEYKVYADGDLIETATLSKNSTNDFFEEGESTTYDLGNILDEYLEEDDDFKVKVCIDTDDDVEESNENNNCLTVDSDDLDENGSSQSCGNFSDVDDHWASDYICSLYDRDVVEGRSSTRFYPDAYVTRAEFLKMTLLGLEMDPYAVSGVYYDDVSSRDWFYSYITYATSRGIVDGYSDGSFRPNDYITRGEAIVLLMRAADQEDYSFSSSDIEYWDVERSDWFAWAVVVTDEFNIVQGYSDDSFRPENYITRGETSKIIELSYQLFVD